MDGLREVAGLAEGRRRSADCGSGAAARFGARCPIARRWTSNSVDVECGRICCGYYWGRSFIRPILALTKGTDAVASGRLDERVNIEGSSELQQLGESFNSMAGKLSELQDNVRRQERQAMFGRIAAGLVHDISHPFQNIGNNCRLIVKLFDDHEYRATFRRTVDREFNTIRRVLDDLRNLARPMPFERFAVDVQPVGFGSG